ncbi:peptidylprolyl isomerase [Spongorhabdus nitratireducens]
MSFNRCKSRALFQRLTAAAVLSVSVFALPVMTQAATTAPATTGKVVPLDRVIAIVDDNVIMQSEFNQRLADIKRQIASRNISPPPESTLKQQVLERLIIDELQLQRAGRAGVRVDDQALNDAVRRIAGRNQMSIEQFRAALEADGVSFAQAREEIRKEMVINRVRQRYVGERINISDQEVDNFISSEEGRQQMSVSVRLGHILISTPDGAKPEQLQAAKREAEEIYSTLKGGADFAQTAVARSSGQYALQGGDLDWRKLDQLPTLFFEQVNKLNVGDITPAFRSPSGFHILKLTGKRGDEQRIMEQFHVRHILVKPNEIRSDLEARNIAEKIYQRIEDGESFAELARVYSDDTASALNGGDMDWINPNDMVPAFRDMVFDSQAKVVSKPFATPFGWHIMEVLGKRDTDVSDDYRRNQVRQILFNRKFEEELQVWLREIRDQAFVELKL